MKLPDEPNQIRLSVKPRGTMENTIEDFGGNVSYSPPWKRMHPINKMVRNGTIYQKEPPGLHGQITDIDIR